MKLSRPVKPQEGPLSDSNDPHCDKQRMPRVSAPASFLSLRAFTAAMVLLSVFASNSASAANSTCVCDFDPTKDYFPTKLASEYAEGFEIEYMKSYKKITVQGSSGPVVTYAYLCGTPRPSEATADNSVQIPIDTVALSSATFLPLVNYIGKRSSLLYVAAEVEDMPACLAKRHEQGLIAGGFDLVAVAPQVKQMALERSKEHPDLVFADNWDYDNVKTKVEANFGEHTQVFRLAQSSEKTALGALEWLEVVAALYNAEPEAAYVVSSIRERYNCVKNLVANIPEAEKVKVMWGNYYDAPGSDTFDGFYLGQCPSFFCEMVKDAGGVFLSADSFMSTESEALAMANETDVWIYPDGNVYAPTDTNRVFMTAARNATFGETNVFKNGRIFDYYGGHGFDWFNTRLAEPDVLLMDLVQAFYGSEFISASRKKVFIRNVHSEPAASQEPRDPDTCEDTEAPLYTGWLAGPCATSGTGGEGLPPSVDLCPLADPSPGAAAQATTSLAALMVVVLAVFASLALF